MKFTISALALAVASCAAPLAHAQQAPAITPTGSEIVTCVASGVPKSCTTGNIAGLASSPGLQNAKTVYAGPTTGAANPSFRILTTGDIPTGATGSVIPLLSGANTWGAKQAFTGAYPGISVSSDFIRSSVNGFPVADQYAGVGYQVNAIVGAVTTPSGTVTGAHIFDSGVSGYAQTNNVLRDAIGLFGEGGVMVSGGSAYGLNTEAINCENHSTTNCGLGKGNNVGNLWSIEADVSLYKVGGAAPTGSVVGVAAVAYAETQPTGQFNAFYAVQNKDITGSQPWKTGLTIDDGAASTAAIVIGAVATHTTGPLGSMSQYFMTYNSAGTQIAVPVYADSGQNLHVAGNSLLIDGASNPALAAHNTTTGVTWYGISNGSGNLQFYNGSASPLVLSAGSVSANVPLQLAPTTFSLLPSCTSSTQGEMAYITDASAAITAWHQQVTAGGGANKAFIACNGSGWFAFDY